MEKIHFIAEDDIGKGCSFLDRHAKVDGARRTDDGHVHFALSLEIDSPVSLGPCSLRISGREPFDVELLQQDGRSVVARYRDFTS